MLWIRLGSCKAQSCVLPAQLFANVTELGEKLLLNKHTKYLAVKAQILLYRLGQLSVTNPSVFDGAPPGFFAAQIWEEVVLISIESNGLV